MTTGERIKYIREKMCLTQKEVSMRAGLGKNTLSGIERGAQEPSLSTLRLLAEAMKVSTLDLLGDTEMWFFTKLDDGAKMPTRAHADDAGFDLFAMNSGIINARDSMVLDTGVHVAIPKGFAGLICSKSGLNINYGLTSDGLIDSGYTGSIKVKLYNNSDSNYLVTAGDKISQIVFIPIVEPRLVKVDELPQTERGTGGFGSTGK